MKESIRYSLPGLFPASVMFLNALFCPDAKPAPVAAQSCQRFIDSMGICTHIQETSGSYGNFDGLIKPRLQELGIKHIRTDLMPDAVHPTLKARIQALGQLGIKTSLIFDSRLQAGSDSLTPAEAVQFIKDCGPANCIAEGPNEPNAGNPGWVFSYNGLGMNQGLYNYTRDLWNAIKGDSQTTNVPIYFSAPIAYGNLGFNVDSFVDYGNMHPYPDGSQPGWDFEKYVNDAREETPTKPLVATETGYHTALDRTDRYWAKPVPEDIQARYLTRTYFYFFNRGVHRTYIYQLMESPDAPGQRSAENHFGILRPDGTHKPAFDAIKNIISILNDNTSASGSLDYTLSGDVTSIETTLLKSSNGKFYLVLYNNSQSYDIWGDEYDVCSGAACYKTPPNRALSLAVNPGVSNARSFTPVNSAAATDLTINGNQISLSVPDHPLIVEITPSGGVGPVADGTYKVIARHSGKAMEVAGGGTNDGANVQQSTYVGGNNQRWTVTHLGNSQYKLVGVQSGRVLDVEGGAGAMQDGANVHIWEWLNASNQKWTISATDSGYNKVLAVHSGKALDVSNVSSADGANIHQWTYLGQSNQEWAFQMIDNGAITREVWTEIGGTSVSNIPMGATPNITDTLTSFEAPTNWGDNYGTRVRGYITAPTAGSYTFWIASDDASELWLSTDRNPANKIKRAWVNGWTNSREWSKEANQKSAAISLAQGQTYYIEALQKEGGGGDNLAVGWAKPGQSTSVPSEVIPGSVLSPFSGAGTTVTYEAESATLANGAGVATSGSASGGQYVKDMHNNNASITWSNVNRSAAGNATLAIRYATPEAAPVKGLFVNGAKVTLNFADSGGWDAFTTLNVIVTMNSGTNAIAIKNDTNTGGVNVDKMDVQ